MAVKPSSRLMSYGLHLANGFFPLGIPVFPFIPWDVWNWKPSTFSMVGSKTRGFFFFFFFVFLLNSYCKAQNSLSLSLSFSPPPPPPISPPFSVTLLFHFSFMSQNIHYITLITCHCHANNLPNTEQAVKTKPKQVFFFHFSSFLTIYLLFKCCFVA